MKMKKWWIKSSIQKIYTIKSMKILKRNTKWNNKLNIWKNKWRTPKKLKNHSSKPWERTKLTKTSKMVQRWLKLIKIWHQLSKKSKIGARCLKTKTGHWKSTTKSTKHPSASSANTVASKSTATFSSRISTFA